MEVRSCAYEPCTCTVEAGEQYCSHVCEEDASGGDVPAMHGRCRCSHSECEAR